MSDLAYFAQMLVDDTIKEIDQLRQCLKQLKGSKKHPLKIKRIKNILR